MKLADFTSNSINFIKEDQTGLLSPGHFKQLPHHPGSLRTQTGNRKSESLYSVIISAAALF